MKKRISTMITCVALLLVVNGLGSFAAEPIVLPAGTLDENELRSLFSGKTVTALNINNRRVSLSYYDPSGTVRQLHKGKIRVGKWNIKENGRICLKLGNERNKCRIVVREKEMYKKYVVKKSSKHKHIIDCQSFVSGNPHNF